MQEDFPSGVDPDSVGGVDGLVIVLKADHHVAGHIEGKHHGPRCPACLPVQPGQCFIGIRQGVSEHAAHIATGWVLLQELDQSGKVVGVLFLVHFGASFTQ